MERVSLFALSSVKTLLFYGVNKMAKNEKTSRSIGSIASKGLKNPGSLTNKEIKQISGSVLTQRPDTKKK